MAIDLVVLNYNGRALLAECLPSLVEAVRASRRPCRLTVVDNASTDDSVDWLRRNYPTVSLVRSANRGLCSFNDVLPTLPGRVAILLNNDIRLAVDAVDRLVEPLLGPGADPRCFATAPRCWLFDGATHEGFKTAVRWRAGFIQATGRFPGHARVAAEPGLTAAAGAVLAVDRARFLALGGFDPLYLPGRIEDLDFCFRGYLAGWHARYVPEAMAYHRGHATFGAVYGAAASDRLALRNTLLFQWKCLPGWMTRGREAVGLAARTAYDLLRAPWQPADRRFAAARAWVEALAVWRSARPGLVPRPASPERPREFFREFGFARVATPAAERSRLARCAVEERALDMRHPISRRYLLPTIDRLARALARTPLRPVAVTWLGAALALAAVVWLAVGPAATWPAALFMLAAWCCDRLDGKLARWQGSATPEGAWLDANLDELVDLSAHAAVAAAAMRAGGGHLPWTLFGAFVVGKYLLMHGLAAEGHAAGGEPAPPSAPRPAASRWRNWLRAAYHFPALADVRAHLLIAALASGWLVPELALLAAYYNLRWLARLTWVPRRLASHPAQGVVA